MIDNKTFSQTVEEALRNIIPPEFESSIQEAIDVITEAHKKELQELFDAIFAIAPKKQFEHWTKGNTADFFQSLRLIENVFTSHDAAHIIEDKIDFYKLQRGATNENR